MTALIIVLIVIAVLAALLLFLVMPSRGCQDQRKLFYHQNLAHRGLHSIDKSIPENSLPAFRAARDAGYGIEFDLQLSKDEQVVVFHDDDLKRVCGDEHRVDFYTYEELQKLRLCGTEERIPLFSELLETMAGRTPLLVEFKNGPKNALLCEKAMEQLRNYKGVYCIESFSPFIVQWFKKNHPEVLRGQLSASEEEFGDALSPVPRFLLANVLTNVLARPHFIAYHKDKRSLTVRLAEKLGAMPVVWTVHPEDDPARIESINDAVIFEFYTPKTKY